MCGQSKDSDLSLSVFLSLSLRSSSHERCLYTGGVVQACTESSVFGLFGRMSRKREKKKRVSSLSFFWLRVFEVFSSCSKTSKRSCEGERREEAEDLGGESC